MSVKNISGLLRRITGGAAAFMTALTCISSVSSENLIHVSAADYDQTFTVGFDAEFPPYGYKDEKTGEYIGFDLDLAEEVCRRKGWNLVKQPIDWDSKDVELTSGYIDCIWNGFTINGREAEYTWSYPYIDNSQVVIVKKSSEIQAPSDLSGRIVAVQTDSSALAAFTGEDATEENLELASSFSQLQQVSDYNNAFMNLEAGLVDAICMDIGVASYQLELRKGQFRMLDESISSEQYGIGFKSGNTELRDSVQETLDEMCTDGTFQKIAEEWDLGDAVCLERSIEAGVFPGDSLESKGGSKLNFRFILGELSKGIAATFAIFFLTLLFSMPLGLLITFVRRSKILPLQWIAKLYISVMRGTPLMLQLLVVFFGPYYVFKVALPSSFRFWAVIIGFSLNYAAYFAEIFRAGIDAVPVGHYEAGEILGYSKTQFFFKIVFPQMTKHVMPTVTNEVVTLVKDTSLAFVLSYMEMFTIAKQVSAATASVIPLFTAGIFYYVFNFVIAFVMARVEKKLNYYR